MVTPTKHEEALRPNAWDGLAWCGLGVGAVCAPWVVIALVCHYSGCLAR